MRINGSITPFSAKFGQIGSPDFVSACGVELGVVRPHGDGRAKQRKHPLVEQGVFAWRSALRSKRAKKQQCVRRALEDSPRASRGRQTRRRLGRVVWRFGILGSVATISAPDLPTARRSRGDRPTKYVATISAPHLPTAAPCADFGDSGAYCTPFQRLDRIESNLR